MKRTLSIALAVLMVLSCFATMLSVVASAEETEAEIVDAAFALEEGKSLSGKKTLTGVVSSIVTEYSSEFSNVTVNMTVKNSAGEDKTIQCYRMKGDDAATVEVGDTIKVTGTIKNYKGTVEFDSGCTFETVKKVSGDYAIKTFAGYASGDVAILVRQEGKTTITDLTGKDYNAYALIICNAEGKVTALDLRGPGRPAGVKGDVEVPDGGFIIGINRDVAGYPLSVVSEAFVANGIEVGSRIKLFGVDLAALATTAAGTALTDASFSVLPRLPETQQEILDAAFALPAGERLEGTYSLTGLVLEKTDNNRQVKIKVADKEIVCFKMVEADYNAIAVGDIITVTGILKNYQGTVEFDTGNTAVLVQNAGKYQIKTFAGYAANDVSIVVRQEGKTTIGDVTGKDYNYYRVILVDAKGYVVDVLEKLGRVPVTPTDENPAHGPEDGRKDLVEIPAGGFAIGIHNDAIVADGSVYADLFGENGVKVDDQIELVGVDLAALATAAAQTALAGATFNLISNNFDEVPEGALAINYAQDWMADICVIYVPLVTGEKTLGEITAVTYGSAMDCKWWNAIVVDADGKVIKKIGMTDKTNEEIPEGGYMIAAHGSSPALAVLAAIEVNSTITLYNCDLAAFAALTDGIYLRKSAFTITEPVVERPASYQKTYELTTGSGTLTYWNADKCHDDGVILTDGKKGSLIGDQTGYNVALTGLSLENPAILTIDLGEAKWVHKFVTYNTANSGWGIAGANAVKVSYSIDGTTFKSAGEVTGSGTIFAGTGSGWTCYEHALELAKAVSARYVRFEITSGGNNKFLWLEEAEVWEGEEPQVESLFTGDDWADGWTAAVPGENAEYQNNGSKPAADAADKDKLLFDYKYFMKDGKLYVGAKFNQPLTKGTGNGNSSFFRIWLKTNPAASSYTHFFDCYVAADDTIGTRAAVNSTLDQNKPTNNEATQYTAAMQEFEGHVEAMIVIPLDEIGATDYLRMFVNCAIEKVTGGATANQCLLVPGLANAPDAPIHVTTGWSDEQGNIGLILLAPKEPITENVLDLGELKIIDVITFTADDPSIGTVRVYGSVDGEEYYDLNAGGAAKVNADTGVASVALTTQGYIQIRYLKVTGTDVNGTISATFKNADEGAFIAPPAGPYDFGSTNEQGYGIVMLENRVVDINAVKGDDYVVAPKNNQLIITKKVANGVYDIIANSVNAWPDQGHPELITAGIEGLNISAEGIITLADDQFAFVIVSSGSIKTKGDEQTAPAKRIDRGLGVNGYLRVDGDKLTLHVNQPEAVPVPENILDLGEAKIIDVITFTADDPSIGTVRVYGSVDGEEYYDLNAGGAAKVNADTGVASVALTTQGYIQIQYIKVEGSNVAGTIEATFKAADEGAFIAPPAGPYDFGSTNEQGYGIVMLENRVVDINAVKGDDYVVAPKNNQLIITKKVANGVYDIIANSVNAWPDQGHPELITAGIEGLNISAEGIITLADDQFAFVIVSSGSIKTKGDEQTAPAKRIDRGLGVNGYLRVDGGKLTLHVNQPEAVPLGAAPTIDGVLDEEFWKAAEFKKVDGQKVGTWQNKVGGFTYEYALAEQDGYVYIAVKADKAGMTQLRVWFHTNPEAKLYTHFFDVFLDGKDGGLKTNQSLTENKGSAYDATKLEAAYDEADQIVEARVKLEDIGATTLGPNDYNVQFGDGNNLFSQDLLPGNFTIDGAMKNSAYMPWIGWFDGEIPTYAGLIPKTNHWTLTPIGTDYVKYYYVDDALYVVDEAQWPYMTYVYPAGDEQAYDIEGNELHYNFSIENGTASIRLIFKTDDGTVQYMMTNTALGLSADQYIPGNGDFKATSCSGVITLKELVESKQLYQNSDFPAAAIKDGKITFAGLEIFAIGGATVVINELAVEPTVNLEPDNYLWLLGTGTDDPGINFKVPGELLAEGDITIKALVKFSEDCTGTVYLNCYAFAEDEFNNWDYLMNFIDYATSGNTALGQWTEVEFTYNPSIATYGKQAGNNQIPAMLSMGIGFWQATGTVSVANIRIEQNGATIWSLDFAEGLDLSKACEDGYYGISDDNKDVRWGVVGAKEPQQDIELFVSHLDLYNWATFDIMLTTKNVKTLSNNTNPLDVSKYVMYSVEKIGYQYVVKEFVNDASMNEAVPPEGGFLLFSCVGNRSYDAIKNGELVGLELVLNNFELTGTFAIDTQVSPGSAETITAKTYVPSDEPPAPPTPVVQPKVKEELPDGAIVIDYAGYKHAGVVSIVAGDNQTVAELTARGNNGVAKDMNYAYNILVGSDNIVIDVDFTLAKACEFVCPEGGYIISYNGNKAGYDVMTKIKVGDVITVYNVLIDKVAELEGNVELTQAGFTYGEPPVRPISYKKAYTVTGNTRTDNFKDDGVKLTDGIMVENGGTAGSAGLPIADGPSITVDLGDAYAVDKFDLHAFGGNWGITIITGIKVAYSLDGENFTDIDVESVADATGNAWQETLFVVTLDAPVKARYVKFTAIGGNYIWADEVEVWESEKAIAPEPIEVEVKVKDNAILTDGQTGFSGGWGDVGTGKVLLVTNTACKEKPMKVIVIDELDEVKKVSGITLDLYHCANVMIGYPEGKAIVSVSADGETYTVVGEFDLAEAELSTGATGTVSNAFTFDAVEAKFVKVELNVGSNAAVLGDSPADGKIYWEFISLAEVSVNAEDVGPVYEQGDLNGDGEVDAIDYLLLKKSILGSYTLSPEEEARADVNGDGEIDARDYIYLKKLVLAQ